MSWVTAVEDQIKKILSESISHKRMVSKGKKKGGRERRGEREEKWWKQREVILCM